MKEQNPNYRKRGMSMDEFLAWAKAQCVVSPDGCLLWPNSRNGYGLATSSIGNKCVVLSRLIYEKQSNCTLQGRECVRHTCQNLHCLNHRHFVRGPRTCLGTKDTRKYRMTTSELMEWVKSKCVSNEIGCEIWSGATDHSGYPISFFDKKSARIHKIIYENRSGKSISKTERLHRKCRNRLCLNPDHIFADNCIDPYGKTRTIGMSAGDLVSWALDKAVKTGSGCMLWMGKNRSGYGVVKHGGRSLGLHRLSLEVKLGYKLPNDLCACHKCNIKNCINPEHLYAATSAQNTADAKRDGLFKIQRGEDHGTSKLNNAAVLEIRDLSNCGLFTHGEIASWYGISRGHVGTLANKKRWTHI